jgi:hypothetical protein
MSLCEYLDAIYGYDVVWNQPRPSINFMNHKEILIGVEIVVSRGNQRGAGGGSSMNSIREHRPQVRFAINEIELEKCNLDH